MKVSNFHFLRDVKNRKGELPILTIHAVRFSEIIISFVNSSRSKSSYVIINMPGMILVYHREVQKHFLVYTPLHDKKMAYLIYRGSYMSAHVLLNLLNKLGKRDKMRGLPSILSLFRNEFNKFNNTRA